jgi:hypothetical protein
LVGKLFDFAANQNLVKEGKCENKKKMWKLRKMYWNKLNTFRSVGGSSTKLLNKSVNKLAFTQISNFNFIEPFQIKFSSALGISAQSSYQIKNLSKEERKLEYQ